MVAKILLVAIAAPVVVGAVWVLDVSPPLAIGVGVWLAEAVLHWIGLEIDATSEGVSDAAQ